MQWVVSMIQWVMSPSDIKAALGNSDIWKNQLGSRYCINKNTGETINTKTCATSMYVFMW